MTFSRWISLLIAVLYVIVIICVFLQGSESKPPNQQEIFEGIAGILIWLGLSLACIWWGDELGQGMIGAKFGLVSKASPGCLVQLIGWVLLFLPVIIFVITLIRRT
ncbi:MAG: hypothetical protein AMJ79_09790 [Phycisphaerae bacterium SM23_30]|nr:MAG: hypothetical protein AMJ79_09790 [Phycisphaerae bacterium SM23_30]